MSLRTHVGLVVAVACSPEPDPPPLRAPSSGVADSGGAAEGADDPGPTDTDTAEGPAWRCPDDTVPVPGDAPVVCVDVYEASLAPDGTTLRSVPGVEPLVGVSFVDAQALCAATPALLDGEVVGQRRLVGLQEWRDAADGTWGDGGLRYPTGEAWPEDLCAVLDAGGEPTTSDLVPTGSLPDCRSPFGVHDQLGNAWEWVDPGVSIDIALFVARQAERGRVVSVEAGTGEVTVAGDPSGWSLEVPGMSGTLGVDAEGRLHVVDAVFQAEEPFDYAGYAVERGDVGLERSGFVLPVEVERVDGVPTAETAPVHVRWDQDGLPLTAKVGCAWYSGLAEGCTNADWFFGHPPGFQGTISPRCAAEPVALD